MIYSIQYMRAIAALLVVVHHAIGKGTQYTSTSSFNWFTVGEVGVDLFFIISGYIMCHTVDSKDINFISFIKARIRRIIPLYWVLTTMALVIYLLFPDKVNSAGGGTNIIHSYTLFPVQENYLISNGWTLSYEFFFYILFAFGLSLTGKFRLLLPVTLIMMLVALGNFDYSNSTFYNFITNPLLLEFSFGILIFYLFKTIQPSIFIGILLVGLSLILITLVNIFEPNISRVVRYGIPALIFFIGMKSLEPIFKRDKKEKINILFEMIGNSSYSLYLSHPFALVISSIILDKLGLTNISFLFITLLVIASIIAGHICYLLLEKNLGRIIKRYETKTSNNTLGTNLS